MATDVPAIRILTVDDHALLRKGIGALIGAKRSDAFARAWAAGAGSAKENR
jgi:hypothetical protein